MGEKVRGIIAAVGNLRLLLQVLSSIDNREYRHKCNAPEGGETSFKGEGPVTGDEVDGRVIGVGDNSAGGTSEPEQSQQQQAACK
jgi:hypothetical protein